MTKIKNFYILLFALVASFASAQDTFDEAKCSITPPADGGVPAVHGITALQRAGANNGNWPMVRNSAYTVLESKTKGFVPTRNNDPENTIQNPVVGMMVWDGDDNFGAGCLKIYTGEGGWKCFNVTPCIIRG